MVQVTRKHENEANENLIRRFNRKVLLSKTERRKKAIIRRERKAEKLANTKMGIR